MVECGIAIVGMACRFPGAENLRRYWFALQGGFEGITHFRREDLVAAGADPELVWRTDYVPARGILTGSRDFDWSFFGYSRAEAATIDPQHRIFLECASQAIDDAGIDPARFPGWIGVYAGAEGPSARTDNEVGPLVQTIGQRQDFLTTRVAYKLGLRGPAVTVQTACSTSLTAVHMAVQSLLAYECDAALAGGVSLAPHGERGYLYEEGGILSPDGHCRPFDEHAAGTVPGEGVGIVVLKRLEDAVRDGDRIVAVIRGSALNNDGGDKIGYTAPSIPGQRDAILLAQKVAEIDPADIDYVEAHGTGTRIGDPVEVQALTDAFRTSTESTGWCWIGAVKSNIGHTGSAAGVAGLIKTVLMFEYRELVPTLHYGRPNPLLQIDTTPFRVCTDRRPWPDRGTPLAAVSSFGVGGTNAHVIVAGPPRRARPAARDGARVLALSALSAGGLDRMRQALTEHLDAETEVSLAEVSRTLAGRRSFSQRQAIVAEGPNDAVHVLHNSQDLPASGSLERVAFVFPGQGTLTNAAGAAAQRLLPGFRAYFDEVADAVCGRYALDLSPIVSTDPSPADWFSDTVHQQLGLLALGYALGRQLGDWGITPVAMLGNSIGEYAAATLAGVWTPADAAGLVYERASAMRATEPGHMVAVSASADEMARRIGPDGGIAIAVAGPERVVISGARAKMDEFLAGQALTGLDTRLLDTQQAFHSAAMDPAAKALRDAVASVPNQAPRLRLVSNASGKWAAEDAVRCPDYWADQLRRTVLLNEGLATLLSAGCDTFVELGPGTSMIGALRRHRKWDTGHRAVPLLGRGDVNGERSLLRALGVLWELGAEIDLEALLDGERPFRCSLPAHPFDSRDPDVAPAPATTRPEPRVPLVPVAVATRGARHQVPRVLERLWCTALGVLSVTDEDDFFTLGGESLMAVNLISRVRQQAASNVAVADFVRTPTFGHLVQLVEQGRTGDLHLVPGIVPLRKSGDFRPLFLAADALGTATSYQVLADLLDVDRPVYGLEPSAPLHRAFPRIAEIAAHHVDAVLRVQRSGPYTIGGWSFGAVVAHEMARRLTEMGEEVDVLVCLDGFVPNRRGLPIALDPAFLTSSLRLQLAAALGTGTIGGLVRRAPEFRRTFIANLGALLRYRPRPVSCPAVLFKAEADRPTAARLRRDLSSLYTDVRVHPVGGDHWSMLVQPHARDLVVKLREVLPARG